MFQPHSHLFSTSRRRPTWLKYSVFLTSTKPFAWKFSSPHSVHFYTPDHRSVKTYITIDLTYTAVFRAPKCILPRGEPLRLPAANLSGIKAQMHQKAAHSLELQPESISLLEELGKREFGMVYKESGQALPREYCRWL